MSEENLPPERDVKDYKFQQLCKVQVRDLVGVDDVKGLSSLIASAPKYGLTFVGIPNGFKVIKTQEIIDQDSKHTSDRLQFIITDIPLVSLVDVGHPVTHLAVSCDGLTLAVTLTVGDRCQLNMYDVRAFAQSATGSVSPFLVVNLGNDALIDLAWNPSGHAFLVTCQASGKLNIFSITDKLEIKAALTTARAKCVCWSPKGKQLVVGTDDGRLVQYDFDLKEKRKWDYPPIFDNQSFSVISIVWLSTYTFLAAYLSSQAESSDQPNLVLVNGSKEGPTTYENFEDICFGTGESRPKKYFFNFIQQWDMVITGSSNASEIAIMAKHLDQKQTWERWNLDDSARAECPLTEDYTDTYPLGMTIDLSSQTVISLGDERTHPPSPLMLILTTAGHVIPYHCMYIHKDAPQITAAPEILPQTGCRQPMGGPATSPVAPQPANGPSSAAKNLFGTPSQSKPLFGTSNQPIGAQNTSAPFSFGSQSESKPSLFGGLGQGGSQSPFGAPATQPAQTGESKPGLFTGSSGNSTFNFSTATATATPGKAFGLSGTSEPQATSTAATNPTSGFPAFGGFAAKSAASSTPSAGSAGFGSFVMPMTATTMASTSSAASGTPAFSFGSGSGPASGSTASPFQAKPTASVASDAVDTKFNSSSITTKSTFNFTTKSSGPPNAFGVATPVGTVLGSKPTAATATVAQPAGAGMFGKPAVSAQGPVSQAAQTGSNPGQGAGFGFPTATLSSAAVKEKGGALPSPAGSGSSLHKSTTLASLTQIEEPEVPPQAKFPPRSPTQAPPPAYPTNQSSALPTSSEVSRQNVDDNQIGDTVDRSFAKSIQEEIQHFEKELQDLKARAGRTEHEIGPRDHMIRLRTKTEEMGKFCEDIKKTVQEQNKDVQEQTSLCLDMFAMVEECRVRQQLNSDPKYKSLLKSRALDSASAEKLQDLQLQNQALDQGLRDVDMILDSQWEDYQNRKKSLSRRVQASTNDVIYRVVKSNHNLILAQIFIPFPKDDVLEDADKKTLGKQSREKKKMLIPAFSSFPSMFSLLVQAPTNDAIYRVVKSNHNLILAQKSRVNEMEERLKQLKLYNKTSTWNNSGLSQYSAGDTSTMLSSLADSLVETAPATSTSKVSNEGSEPRMNKLAQLRDHLYHRHVPIVRSTKPENLSMSRLTIPDTSLICSPQKTQPRPVIAPDQMASMAPEPRSAAHGLQQTGITQAKGVAPADKPQLIKPTKQGPPPKPAPAFTVKHTGTNIANTGTSSFAFSQPQGGSSTSQFQFNVAQGATAGQTFAGFGSEPTASTGFTAAKVKEINGIKFEDITPSGSENETEENEVETEEDDEYDDDDDDDDDGSSGESNGAGFGLQYNMTGQGSQITSTPVATKPPTADVVTPKAETTSTPVGRKLFGQSDAKTAGTFQFGAATSQDSSFSFGGGAGKPAISKPITAPVTKAGAPVFGSSLQSAENQSGEAGASFSVAQSTKTDNSAGNQSGKTGFNFGTSTGSGFTFGTNDSKPTTGMTGLFGSKPTVATGPQNTTSTTSKTFSFGSEASQSAASASAKDSDASSGAETTVSSTAPATIGPQTTTSTANKTFSFGSEASVTAASASAKDSDASSCIETTVSSTAPTTLGAPGAAPSTTEASSLSSTKPAAPATGLSFGGFGTSTSGAATSQAGSKPLFGSSSGVFGNSPVVQPSSNTDSSTDKPGLVTSSSAAGGLFGKGAETASGTTSLFGEPLSGTTSKLGALLSATDSPPDGTAQTTKENGQSSVTTQPSSFSFGQSGSSTQPSTFSFGQPASTTQTTTPLFGQTATKSGGGLFGQSTTSGGSLFGQTATTSNTGLFGQSISTSSGGLFGQPATTSGGGIFGQSTTTSSGGLFGQTTTSSSGGLFGQTTTSSSGGIFGQTTTSSSGSLFGQTATSSSTAFGSQSTNGAGLFGKPATPSSPFSQGQTSSSNAGGGLFGSSTTSAAPGLFGAASTAGSSLFGSPASTASTGLFGASSTSASSGPFGTSSSGAGAFTFGQSPGFGQTASPGSSFGGGGSGVFGQSGGGEGGSGGLFAGLGGKPSAEKANTNVFGGGTFGSQAQTSSSGLFGSSSPSTFGTSTNQGGGGAFSGGQQAGGGGGLFSGGGAGVGSTGFGSGAQQPAAGGFGSSGFGAAPAFGGSPAFGSPPRFGSAPAFGGGGTFGATPTFGSANPMGGGGATFGSASGNSGTGFAGFASAGSPTFGALAQSTDAPTFGALNSGGGNTGFGSPSFGGGQQNQPAFGGGSSFGSSPQFTGYRG